MSSHTAQTELSFLGKLLIEGDLVCETGLHIGAGKGTLEIGGADNPVVKDAFGRPYVPGSSLRGRLRSLLEQVRKFASMHPICPMTKSASCSAAPQAASNVSKAKRSARIRSLRHVLPFTMLRSISTALPPQCARVSMTS